MNIFLALASLFPFAVPSETKLPQEEPVVPTVIIGGGIGGGTAAVYLGRAQFKPLVLQGQKPGGALAQSDSVENWPGALKITGAELMSNIREQAIANGAEFLNEEVVSVDFKQRPFTIVSRALETPDQLKVRKAASCIIATGAKPNFLAVPGEQELWGRGVSNCAICDGSLYRGKRVGIVGGGDSALLEALYLSNIANKVDLFVRKDRLRAIDESRKASLATLPHVEIHYLTEVKEIKGGDRGIASVVLQEQGKVKEEMLDGLFLAIGSKPNTALFEGQLELDAEGYIMVDEHRQTSIEGVYAIGDAVDRIFKQASSAAGDAVRAALAIQTKLSASAPQLLAAYRAPTRALVASANDTWAKQGSTGIVEVTSKEQLMQQIQTNKPMIVDFYATWCPPCKNIAPLLETFAAKMGGSVIVVKVNVEQANELTQLYQIRAMPTVLYFNQGKLVDMKIGENEIRELLARLGKL